MWSLLIKYLSVFSGSMLKFIFGPVAGVSFGLSFLETFILTVLGMMATVIIITFAGGDVRRRIFSRFFKNRKIFTPRNRKVVKIWRKYGMWGVAILTPLLFSPPGGSIIAVSFGEKKGKILTSMFVSAVIWSLFFSGIITYFGEKAIQLFS